MIQQQIQSIPQATKHMVDGAAATIAAVHFLGWWKDNVSTILATAGLVWVLVQMYYYIKDKRKGK